MIPELWFDTEEQALRDAVDRALRTDEISDVLRRVSGGRASGGCGDLIRQLYAALGRAKLLAVSWPIEFGGRGFSAVEEAVVLEQLAFAGVPDTPYNLSIQIFGSLVREAGNVDQRRSVLPKLSSGTCFGAVLLSEPGTGSDAAAIQTVATQTALGFRLHGVKTYSLMGTDADLAVVSARVDPKEETRYRDLALFLVDLKAKGVEISHCRALADEDFYEITLHRVDVTSDALLGRPGQGWGALDRCLANERTGVEYSIKGQVWLGAAAQHMAHSAAKPSYSEFGRLEAGVTAGRLLSRRRLEEMTLGCTDHLLAALTKLCCSESAQAVAYWAGERLLWDALSLASDGGVAGAARTLEAAYREAPGLTMSAGTSEIMLTIISELAQVGDADWGLALATPMGVKPAPCAQEAVTRAFGVGFAGEDPLTLYHELWASLVGGEDRVPDLPAVTLVDLRHLVVDPLGDAPLAMAQLEDDGVLWGTVAVPGEIPGSVGLCLPATTRCGSTCLVAVRVERSGQSMSVRRQGAVTEVKFLGAPVDGSGGHHRRRARGSPVEEQELIALGRLRHAAWLYGTAARAYEETVAYAQGRQQFGQSIIKFQSVAFGLARSYAELQCARHLLHRAAVLHGHQGAQSGTSAQVLAYCLESTLRVVRRALQVQGARGLLRESVVAKAHISLLSHGFAFGDIWNLWAESAVARLTATPSPTEASP